MALHALNNAATVPFLVLGDSTALSSATPLTTGDLWLGIALAEFSAPWLLRYIIANWPRRAVVLPYDAQEPASALTLAGDTPTGAAP